MTEPTTAPGTACPSCGVTVPTGSRFCESCGAAVDGAVVPLEPP